MEPDSPMRVCLRCRRRPRVDGGRGSCPFPEPFRAPFLAGLRECPQFRIGDVKTKRVEPIAQTGLW